MEIAMRMSVALMACLSMCQLAPGAANACTAFCIDRPGGPVVGVNLDFFFTDDGLVFINQRGVAKQGYEPGRDGNSAQWVSSYGSITFSLAGREFAWGGMNEAGLVVTSLELSAGEYSEPDERPPLSSGTWVQYLLDTSGSVDEAIRASTRVRVQDTVPNHHYIADAQGNHAVVEWLNGKKLIYRGDSLPVPAIANMRYGRSAEAVARGGPRWWWSNPGQSAERVAGAASRAENYDPGRDGPAVSYALDTLTQVVAAPNTKWNVVFDTARREVWFRSIASPALKHVSLGAFDLSCGASLLMLDINAALGGDVESSFVPYGRQRNLQLFASLVAGYGIEVPEEDAVALMQLFETFGCARH